MLIDVTFFTSGPRQIENAVATQKTANQIAVAERINGYIEALQPEFLRRAAGKQWCSVIDEYSKTDHQEPSEEELKVGNLADMLKEPFADYVFFYMLRDMNVQPTITGLVQLKCANSYVSPLEKGVQTWNRMVDKMRMYVGEIAVEGVTVDSDLLTHINTFNL